MVKLLALFSLLVIGCSNEELRPRVDRGAVIALEARGEVASMEGAIKIWEDAGIRFERCAAGIPVRVDAQLNRDLLGEYRWTSLAPTEVVIRLDDATVLAHELGHVLGLEHLADEDVGLMSWTPLADELTVADYVEFERSAR